MQMRLAYKKVGGGNQAVAEGEAKGGDAQSSRMQGCKHRATPTSAPKLPKNATDD